MPNHPKIPATEITGNSGVFTDFMRKLMRVPHSEIKAKLEAEKQAKRTPKNVSRASHAPSTKAT